MNAKRGSALLIVLGFLSFMVVSAVAFSIYMRSERIPSSVFRRGVQTRHLVKAALARAMSEIDDAIRDDPYPGMLTANSRRTNVMDEDPNFNDKMIVGGQRAFDRWYGRVFMPPNPDYDANGNADGSFMAPDDETVAVINLEGLGYLPPPLINDVRFLARGSWAAKWRTFDYGAGRFAYCAVNVSDFWDVNRTLVDTPRSSFNRVSLAYLLANDNSVDKGIDVTAFNTVVKQRGGTLSDWPLVSMLDYNLAVRNASGNFESPFFKWLGRSSSSVMYQGGNTDPAGRTLFVTDSWYPPSGEEARCPSLAVTEGNRKTRGQPFDLNTYNHLRSQESIDALVRATSDLPDPDTKYSKNNVRFEDMFSNPDLVALYDYLDRDDIPTSLAMPTTERTPMVVGISAPGVNFDLKVQQTAFTTPDATTPVVTTPVKFDMSSFRMIGDAGIQVTVAFPFKHGEVGTANLNSRSYRVEAVAKMFFVKADSDPVIALRSSASWRSPMFRPSNSDYTGSSAVNGDIITFVATPQTVSFNANDPLAKDVNLRFNSPGSDITAVTRTDRYVTPPPGSTVPATITTEWTVDFHPLDAGFAQLYGGATPMTVLPTDNVVPVFCVWVRLVGSDGGTFVVDCVPATFVDDGDFNGSVLNRNTSAVAVGGRNAEQEPLLRFTGRNDKFFNYQQIGTLATTPGVLPTEWKQKSVWAVDPRYNFAPEDWCYSDSQVIGPNEWENKAFSASGEDGRDGDPYLFVSNQGYLQSMGEIGFLPRQRNAFCDAMNDPDGGLKNIYNGARAEYAMAPGDIAANGLFWRTYCPWDEVDGLFKCGIAEGVTGARVNPYSGNVTAIMGALANTPVNWWAAAGTNTQYDASKGGNSADTVGARTGYFKQLSSALKFAFNETGSARAEDHELKYQDLRNLAANMANAFRVGLANGQTWEQTFDSWDWTPTGTPFSWAGSQFCDQLDVVDCKYLHSYWRGCFGNRQQLFLVFVRAESQSLGGTGEGQIPPQQGGRAVALVWRDPENPVNASGTQISQTGRTSTSSWVPHQMRVLFYHQFD